MVKHYPGDEKKKTGVKTGVISEADKIVKAAWYPASKFFEHFQNHGMPHPNCIVYKDGHIEHYHPDLTAADVAGPTPAPVPGVTVNPATLMGKINKSVITWSLMNSSGDIPDTEKEAIGFALGITQWALRLGVKFQRVKNNTQADVPIQFLKPGDQQYAGLFPDDSILEVTYYPIPQNGAFASHMFFNDDFRNIWSIDGKAMPCSEALRTGHATGCTDPNEPLQTLKITCVGRHAFGHAIGMMHFPQTSTDTMYPYYDVKINKLGPDEITVAQSAYGVRSPPVEQTFIDSIDNIVAMES